MTHSRQPHCIYSNILRLMHVATGHSTVSEGSPPQPCPCRPGPPTRHISGLAVCQVLTKYATTILRWQIVPPHRPQLCLLPLLGHQLSILMQSILLFRHLNTQELLVCGLLLGEYVFRDLSCSLRHRLGFNPDPLARIGKRRSCLKFVF